MIIEIIIDKQRCKGCGLCINACPKDVIEMSEITNKNGHLYAQVINPEYCIGCGDCNEMCPEGCMI